MTREDAITIVEMIVSSWPGQTWDEDRLSMYVNSILDWDAANTTRAVARATQHLRYRPSVAELREFVQIEWRAAKGETAFDLPPRQEKPDWVLRWERARAAGDLRVFPEQMVGLAWLAKADGPAYAPPDAPLSDSSVFVQAHEYPL